MIVIQLFPDGLESPGDLGIIYEPPELPIAIASNHDLDFETVAMQSPAFVRFRQIRKQMRGFKLKRFS